MQIWRRLKTAKFFKNQAHQLPGVTILSPIPKTFFAFYLKAFFDRSRGFQQKLSFTDGSKMTTNWATSGIF